MKKRLFFLAVGVLIALAAFQSASASGLSDRLKGKILLQVEANGESWYVNPANGERYFLGRPADAFRLMRELGLGVSEADFNRWNSYAPSRLWGRILLRVEAHGEAYYVSPVDGKMYFLGRPADAFAVMREQGLGITDANLAQITVAPGNGVAEAGESGEEPGAPDNGTEAPVCPEAACAGNVWQSYQIVDNQCVLETDDCSDCSCTCGGYDRAESVDNGNCDDGLDNDCNNLVDSGEAACQPAGTAVAGDITANTVWTEANSPYLISSDIAIAAGATLSIEPGVKIEFAAGQGETEFGGYTLTVSGELDARGSSANHIIFTSGAADPAPGDWGAIEAVNGGTLDLEYAEIHYAAYAVNAPNARLLTIEHCLISENAVGLKFSTDATVTYNILENNQTGMIYSSDTTSPRDNGSYHDYDRVAVADYNTIRDNAAAGEAAIRAGVIFENITNGGFRLDLKYNLISGNTNGLAFDNTSYYNYLTVEKNNIENNLEYNVVVNAAGPNITLDHNWWGTTVPDTIDAGIFDFYDVSYALPAVVYRPFEPAEVAGAGAGE